MRFRFLQIVLSIFFVVSVSHAQGDASLGAKLARDQAVELARNAQYEEAISLFSRLREDDPTNQGLLQDEIAALGWAERDSEVLARISQLSSEEQPLFVVTAVAKSARNLRQYAESIGWYERAMAIDPENLDVRLGMAMVLAESGDAAAGISLIDELPTEVRFSTEVLLIRAYIQREGNDLIQALHAYELLLERVPDHQGALRGKALVLRDLLLPIQALIVAEDHPGVLTDEEIARLRVDDLAVRLRLVSQTIYPVAMDGGLLDETIAAIDQHLAENRDPNAELALRYDRIAALAEREYGAQAIEAFTALDVDHDAMPAYVLSAAGKSYLQLEQPQSALPLLRLATEKAPTEIETQFALFYAYLDLDHYKEAMAVADTLTTNEPLVMRAPESPVIKGNDNRLRAEIITAIAEASIDQMQLAQERLENLLNEAPHNTDLRHELANIYRWRGWLDRSLFEYQQVLAVEDEFVHAIVGHAHTQLDAQQFQQVEDVVTDLTAGHSNELVVSRLTERWNIHNRSELVVEVASGESTGSTFGSDQRSIDMQWFTQPIRYNYRAYVSAHDSYAEFPEGRADRSRIGAGAEYRANRWTVRGGIQSDRDGGGLGVDSEFNWRMSDRWQLAGLLELDSNGTQLRAHQNAVESDRSTFAARYAPNETMEYGVGVGLADFSDNNSSSSVFGDFRRRMLVRPRWIVELVGEVSSGKNSRQDVTYFSPISDLSYLVGGRHQWRIHRRYDRSLYQSAEVSIGRYDQSGFSAGRIWRADYRISLDLAETISLEVGAQRARMFYDGGSEHDTSVFASVRVRL